MKIGEIKGGQVQFHSVKTHHYLIMPLNMTPKEYTCLEIYNKEMTFTGMYNFYMNVNKNNVEAAFHG